MSASIVDDAADDEVRIPAADASQRALKSLDAHPLSVSLRGAVDRFVVADAAFSTAEFDERRWALLCAAVPESASALRQPGELTASDCAEADEWTRALVRLADALAPRGTRPADEIPFAKVQWLVLRELTTQVIFDVVLALAGLFDVEHFRAEPEAVPSPSIVVLFDAAFRALDSLIDKEAIECAMGSG